MPTPILKIPIDDAAFQRYLATFAKYQTQLESQPQMWKATNDAMGAVAFAGAAVAAEIAHQADETRKAAAEEGKREEALRKADAARRAADKEQADRDKETAARRRKAIEDVREYGRSLADAAVNLGKWALLGEGAALAGGALSLWGLDRFAVDIGNQRKAAHGLNVSIGQLQGADTYLGRFFDPRGVLENVVTAQESPDQWGLFRMMGIRDFQNKNPKQLMDEMAIAARRMFIGDRENLALADAQGLTKIFAPDTLRNLAATPESELQGNIDKSNRIAGLEDKVAKKWADFSQNLVEAELNLKNNLIGKLAKIDEHGDLEKIIQKFSDLGAQVLDRIDFKQLGDGLDRFTSSISSGDFQKNFTTFIDDVGLVAKKLDDALKLLGIIPTPDDEKRKARAKEGFWGKMADPHFNFWTGWDDGISPKGYSPPLGGADSIESWMGKNVTNWFNGTGKGANLSRVASFGKKFMSDLGLGSGAVAGILSNSQAESGNIVQNEKHPLIPGSRGGYGLFQWTGPRRKEFEAWASTNHMDPRSDAANIGFFEYDMKTHFGSLLNRMKSEDAKQAAVDFFWNYEAGRDPRLARLAAGHVKDTMKFKSVIDVHHHNHTGQDLSTVVNSAAGG